MTADSGRILLLVEDEVVISLSEKMQLEKCGYKVMAAYSGEEAIAVFRRGEPIDLILMDIDLGEGMDGTEAGESILRIRDVPIVYLSSHSEPEVVAKTEKITSYGYVVKHSSTTVLDASIKMAFRLFEANQNIVTQTNILHEKNQLLENILDHFPGSVFWKDLRSVYLGCNATEAKIAGLSSPADIIGKTDFDLGWIEGEAESFRESDRVVFESGEPTYGIEERHDFGGGNVLWNETSKIPLFDKLGAMIGVVGISVDITKRKEIEEALRKSEERLKDIIYSSYDWIWEVDENGVYVFSSGKASDFLGYSEAEILGRAPFDFMEPDEVLRVRTIFRELASKKEPIRNVRNWNVAKDGRRVCLLTSGLPILDSQGRLKGYCGVDRDVTERMA